MHKMFSIAEVQTKVINCNSANKSCLLQVVHTKAIAALTQFCDFCSTLLVAQIVQLWIVIRLICLFPTRDRYVNYFLNICILMKLKARGTYLAAKFINLEISSARYIYIYIYIYIYPARNIHISLARDRHLDCI